MNWPSHNSDRLDVVLSRDWQLCPADADCDWPVITRVLPADEAFVGSDFVTEAAASSVDGGDGRSENVPNGWLVAYWMRQYYQLEA